MNLEEQAQQESEKGTNKKVVGGKERKIAKVERKTKEGKQRQQQSEESRIKQDQIIKATLKQKKEEDEDSGWESVEEDYPHVKLDELKNLEEQLAGMNIGAEDEDDDADEDDMEEEKEIIGGK